MDLSKIISDLIEAQNEHNSKTFADQFSEDAVVYDEGKTHHGTLQVEGLTTGLATTGNDPVPGLSLRVAPYLRRAKIPSSTCSTQSVLTEYFVGNYATSLIVSRASCVPTTTKDQTDSAVSKQSLS